MKAILLISTFLLFSLLSWSQATIFTPLNDSITGIPINLAYGGLYQSDYRAIDFDNDSDLDIYIGYNKILENLGNDSFALVTIQPGGSRFDWYDFDHDGDLDILASYIADSIIIYENTLPDSIGFVRLTGLCYQLNKLMWGWFNIFNDGSYCISSRKYYINNPNYFVKLFSTIGNNSCRLSLKDSIYSPVIFLAREPNICDVNNDGFLDIINATSWSINGYNRFSLIHNGLNSNNLFSIYMDSIVFNNEINTIVVDINNDGYLDQSIFWKDFTSNQYLNKLLSNNHDNTFSKKTNTGIPNNINSKQLVFDFNNDGRQDILLTNANDTNVIYANFGNFSFIEYPYINSLERKFQYATSADFDNDGDLDLLISGYKPNQNGMLEPYTSYFRNDSTPPNTPPTAPITMWTTMDSTKVIFHWNRATDMETPQITLSYNLMVGTSSKAIDITSPLSDTVTGFRRVVELGNAQLNNFYILDKSIFNIGDTVYWSVQTIDNGFGYSPFSQEGSAIIYGRMEAPVFDTICGNDSVYWRSSYYTSSGRYKDSYALDSAFFLDLEVHPAYLDKQDVDICSGSTYTWKGNTYYNSGIYNIQHYTSQGCDSVERLVLNVRPDFTTLLTEDICMGDSLLFAGKHLKSSGVYWDTLSSIYACDSLLELTLTVSPADTSIVQSGDTLFAKPQNASFRWWNCDKQEFVYAAYQSYFVPFQNGHYAAEISSNGCSFLTQCYEITGLSIDDTGIPDLDVNIMPNPNDGEFYLELKAQGKQEYQIEIFDALGKEIYNQQIKFENYKKLKLNLKSEVSGVYQLRIVSGNDNISRRFIIR